MAALEANGNSRKVKAVTRSVGKGGLAILDQGLFGGANFVVNILLARWLTPTEFGAFGLAQAVFLLFAAFHSAILIEPMMVFGSGKYADRLQHYLGILLWGHFGLMLPVSLVLVGVAFALREIYSVAVEQALLALAATGACMLLLLLLRQIFYVRLQPGWSAMSAGIYCAAGLSCLYAIWTAGYLSSVTAFGALAVGSVSASALSLYRIRPKYFPNGSQLTARAVAQDHWSYGRWSTATALLMWLPGNIYYTLLPAWVGLEGVAGLKALMNLVMPLLQSISAVSNLVVPQMVRDLREGGTERLAKRIRIGLVVFCAPCFLYLGAIWFFRNEIFGWLYHGKYVEYAAWPLLLVGLLPLCRGIVAIFGGSLRALERPDQIFRSYVVSKVVGLVLGVPLAAWAGVSGAAAGLLLSSIATAVGMAWLNRRILAKPIASTS